jgi:hypothetical protein
MRDKRRTIVIPVDVHVDTVPPRARLRGVSNTTLTPGGIVFSYETNEFGRPLLLVDGKLAAGGPGREPAGLKTLTWAGRALRKLLPPGIYSVSLVVEDRAGNRSEPTDSTTIAVTAGEERR